uniref:kinesin-like protein KIF28P isoform X2 n=1 Tax=Ciona intestinalis TaxID=7719 RepID=UPI000EF4AB2B|nr:kinesin-like protein KIF28P isoform X2 [Ciona intestinalis]|eukprot:XP_026689383.1 kinesin-like protein KIF28P isoform X2 [Ciona intestinalis]
MVENTTILKDPDKIKNDKKFTFDYSYWSHDGYEEQDDGYYAPVDPRYADQRKVFDDLGRGVLANAWEGFNCSLFAYGQTGSGKSYSIFGYDKNKGIVPATCKQLFEEIDQKPTGHYPVTVSMVEIYNEKVKDLLSNKTDLKIRENAKTGFYVKDLKVQTVVDYEGIQLYIDKGNSNRTVAKTVMNDTSSRAHTIFTLTLDQTMGAEMRKTSVINLVDLAGSERVGRNDVKGKIFDEGKNINLSLLTLGNCINSIVKNEKPAFRNSVMTKLLKNALGGNSKTIMLAALSPSDSDYGETLSTLRFADRAKQIKTKAVVNEDPNVKLIRELREEIAQLKDQLQQTAAPSVPMEKYTEVINKNEEQIKSLQTQLEKSAVEWESRMRENEKSIRADLKEKKAQKKKRKRNPHIWSLNSDIMLSGAVVQYTPVGQTTVGSSKESNIQILGIQSEHTVITNEENEHIFISPVSEEATVRVNGIRVTEKTRLAHHDRILFGSVDLFVFEHPYELAKLKRNNMKPTKASFELARSEIFLHCSYEDLLEQDSTFLKGFTEDEYKKMKEDFIKKQEEEAQMLNSNHENAQVDFDKRFAEEIGKLVEWQGKLAKEAEKEHTQQREALEAEIRILRSDKNANETENVAKVKVLELHKIMYADAAVRKLEKQKQWYDMKIGKLNEEFDKDIKMKDFEQERTRMLNDLEQLEQNEERMQNMKQKYKNDAQKLQAEKDHKYVKEKLKEMQLLLKNMEQTDPKQNAMHLIEYENQCQILQQIQKKRNQEKFPHFWNLNEEPDLCKVIIHIVMPGESTIGSAEKAKIKISGHGILENHALVENDGKDVYIQPLADNIQILVNGKVVSGKQKLQDNDSCIVYTID